jgi:NAD-dependent dihydropyrimidine dehydrogenase PreA subunit
VSLEYLRGVVTLELDPERCTGCGRCLEVCPHAVFAPDGDKVAISRRDACMECGACARNCAFGAISVQSGVGCANAVINRALGRKGACCVAGPDGAEGKDDCCC